MNILLCQKVCGFSKSLLFGGFDFDLLLARKSHREDGPVSGPKPKPHVAQYFTKETESLSW